MIYLEERRMDYKSLMGYNKKKKVIKKNKTSLTNTPQLEDKTKEK